MYIYFLLIIKSSKQYISKNIIRVENNHGLNEMKYPIPMHMPSDVVAETGRLLLDSNILSLYPKYP